MTKIIFKDRGVQACYETARRMASDNFGSYFYGKTPMGPRNLHRGAGHRCYYWNGYQGTGIKPSVAWVGYAFWAAGRDDRKALGR